MNQKSFADILWEGKEKATRREKFLGEISQKAKLSLRDAAAGIGISPSALSLYENNKRAIPLPVTDAFAAIIGVEPVELAIQLVRVSWPQYGRDPESPLYVIGRTIAELVSRREI